MRVADELRGSSASLSAAANRSSIGLFLSRAIALSRARRPEYFLVSLRRLPFFSIELFFAINISWLSASEGSPSLPEREVECSQQRARLVVGFRAGADRDVHAPDIGRLVVVDLGENDVLLDAQRVVAAAIEALRRQPAEIAYARQRDIHQPVEELVHAGLAQRHLAADRLPVAQLVGGDRFPGLGDHRLLTRDQAEIAGGGLDLLAVVDAFADAHVEHHLFDHRHLQGALVAELLGQLLSHHLFEIRLQARRDALLGLPCLRRLFRGLALGGLVALLGLRDLWRLLALVALFRPRSLFRFLGLSRLGLGFGISHRSQLLNAWPPAPCAEPRRCRRT